MRAIKLISEHFQVSYECATYLYYRRKDINWTKDIQNSIISADGMVNWNIIYSGNEHTLLHNKWKKIGASKPSSILSNLGFYNI